MGLQPWAPEIVGDPAINIEENSHGPLKFFPYGPTCNANGKNVETYVTCSENGSITGKILTDVLKHLDTHMNYDREEATPFLLLDGHRSRFELPFLQYIADERTKWTVCIGVPYGMNLWQVGDSSQQDGAFKMRLPIEKKKLIEQKAKLYMDCKIEKHDVVGLVHRSWNKSFKRVESNKRAMAE